MQTTNTLPLHLRTSLEAAFDGKKYPLAKLVSLFENRQTSTRIAREKIDYHLRSERRQPALIIGLTGTPGAGKSSLIGALCDHLLTDHAELRIAVIAVDPSSRVSGGALLGDRTRIHLPQHANRLFFRSQASNLELGGISQQTFQVCRLLRQLFDLVFIETVGIGQNEIEIQHLADYSALVMQPLAGDQVQFMKCGIMEVPDCFVVNKCDEEALARQSYELLRSSLKLAQITDSTAGDIFLTSTIKNTGIEELATHLLAQRPRAGKDFRKQERYYLERWLLAEYGRQGHAKVQAQLDQFASSGASYEALEDACVELLSR